MNTTTQSTTITNLEQFYQELLTDPVLQEQLRATTNPDGLYQLVVELGEERGYHFTKEEVQAALAIEAALVEHELSVPRPTARSPICHACYCWCGPCF